MGAGGVFMSQRKHWYNDLLTAWLMAVTAEYLLLPEALRTLDGLEGLAQMSPVRVALVTALLTPVPWPRWVMGCVFAVLAGAVLWASFTWPLLVACLLAGVAMAVYAWHGVNRKPPCAASGAVGNRKAVGWMAAVFFLFLCVWGVSRVVSFRTPTYDFGIFSQMFYRMKETGLPMTTLERDGLLSHFAVHVSPIYYLMLPVYWLFPTPATLQILQAAVVTSAVIPLWKLAGLHGLSGRQQTLVCGLLLLLPVYAGGCSYDLHENCFLTPLILWLFYGIDRRHRGITAVAALLTLMVKEDAAVYVAVIGLWLLIGRKEPVGGTLLGASLLWFFAATEYLAKFGDGVMTYRYQNFLYDGSGSLASVVLAVLMHPMKAVYACVDPRKLYYIAMTLLPLLGLPLWTRRYERYILLIPYILINLMSDYEYQHSIWFQYSFGSGAFLIYLTVVNLADLRRRRLPLIASVCIAAICFCSTILPVAAKYPIQAVAQRQTHQALREALDQIPEEASVTASTFFTTYLSQRDVIYDLGYASKAHILASSYVVIDPEHDSNWEKLSVLLEQNGYALLGGDVSILIYRKPHA